MDRDAVISLQGVSKKFCRSLKRTLLYGSLDTVRAFLGLPVPSERLRKAEFWSLDDVNMEIKKGEIVGIIGENGAGKSTLLRLISGIFPPDKGQIVINGRLGGLIAVGAGFHPHMTGRENIYLNGVILGMTREEIDRKFDDIVRFADIGDFLDAPVSTYSSGMGVRLGFAIAIHTAPEILLVDEVLSVGDLAFRNKSLRKMSEFRDRAKAVLFISHDIEQIRTLCTRVIVLQHGRKVFDGNVVEGLTYYEGLSRDKRVTTVQLDSAKRQTYDVESIKAADLGLLDDSGKEARVFQAGSGLTIFFDFELTKHIEEMIFYATVTSDASDQKVILSVSNDQEITWKDVKPGKYRMTAHYPNPHLAPGVYVAAVGVRNSNTFETLAKVYSDKAFRVEPNQPILERGNILVDPEWKLTKLTN